MGRKKHLASTELKQEFSVLKEKLPKDWVTRLIENKFGKKSSDILIEYHRLKNIGRNKGTPSPSDLKRIKSLIDGELSIKVKSRLRNAGIRDSDVIFGNSINIQDSLSPECIKN